MHHCWVLDRGRYFWNVAAAMCDLTILLGPNQSVWARGPSCFDWVPRTTLGTLILPRWPGRRKAGKRLAHFVNVTDPLLIWELEHLERLDIVLLVHVRQLKLLWLEHLGCMPVIILPLVNDYLGEARIWLLLDQQLLLLHVVVAWVWWTCVGRGGVYHVKRVVPDSVLDRCDLQLRIMGRKGAGRAHTLDEASRATEALFTHLTGWCGSLLLPLYGILLVAQRACRLRLQRLHVWVWWCLLVRLKLSVEVGGRMLQGLFAAGWRASALWRLLLSAARRVDRLVVSRDDCSPLNHYLFYYFHSLILQ